MVWKTKKKKDTPREDPAAFFSSVVAELVMILFVLTFVGQSFAIPSGSMENTLLVGDHVFVNRIAFSPQSRWARWFIPYRDIHDGDIFVFFSPSVPDLYVVKRVMGVPGDRIHLRNGVVYRNGKKLDEPYVIHDPSAANYIPYRDDFPTSPVEDFLNVTPEWQLTMKQYIVNGDLVVPPGNYFAMGDNRDVSLDSRYWGFVPQENVVGRPLAIYWSVAMTEDEYLRTLKGSMSDRLGIYAHMALHFFDQTRWKRTFRVVR